MNCNFVVDNINKMQSLYSLEQKSLSLLFYLMGCNNCTKKHMAVMLQNVKTIFLMLILYHFEESILLISSVPYH